LFLLSSFIEPGCESSHPEEELHSNGLTSLRSGIQDGLPRLRKVKIIPRKDPWAVKSKRAYLRKSAAEEWENDFQVANNCRSSDKDRAYSLFKKLHDLDPKNVSVLLALSELAVESRCNRTEATILLKDAVSLDPQNVNALSNFGYALECWYNRPMDAEDCYKSALLLQPNNMFVINNLASLLESDLLSAAYLEQAGTNVEHQEMVFQARKLYEYALVHCCHTKALQQHEFPPLPSDIG